MAREGGNPDLEKYWFQKKYDWSQPCDQNLTLRVPQFLKDAIREKRIKPGWQEAARQAIASYLED